ncbi:MAG: carbohydrate-binding domain-containing protein [Firmicutes bacterium]|nr:carbohydrate-binding domain-containing protein [Bacillota bacterium]
MKKIFYFFSIISLLLIMVSCQTTPEIISELPSDSNTIERPVYDDEDTLNQIMSIDETFTFTTDLITSSLITANIDKNTVTITEQGIYALTGSSSDAQVIINADDTDLIILVLDNLNLTSLNGPVIDIENANKVIMNVKDNTTNQLTDSSTSSIDHQSVIYSKDDLTINGLGTLEINANYNNGINVNDELIIFCSTLIINASNTAIKANNSLSITDANLTLTSGNDGIHVENDTDLTKGSITIESGTFTINSTGDAISSSLDLNIMDGTFDITSGSLSSVDGKGLKATHNIIIANGTFNIESIDDSIHSNSGILIDGGEFNLSTIDDAVHSDDELVINDGIIYIVKCFEGLESYILRLNGGYIDITSTDDGINGSGGVNQSEVSLTNPDPIGTASLFITGGTIIINTMSDGIDTNGRVEMSGGLVIISGPLDGMQGAIDYDTTFNISGGTLVAAGASGREQKNPSSTSTQNCVTIYLDAASTQMIHVETSTGETILSYTPEKTYQTLVFSSPDMIDDDSYVVYIGGTVVGAISNTHGYIMSGSYSNGNLLGSFSTTSILSTVGTPTVTDIRPPRP